MILIVHIQINAILYCFSMIPTGLCAINNSTHLFPILMCIFFSYKHYYFCCCLWFCFRNFVFARTHCYYLLFFVLKPLLSLRSNTVVMFFWMCTINTDSILRIQFIFNFIFQISKGSSCGTS